MLVKVLALFCALLVANYASAFAPNTINLVAGRKYPKYYDGNTTNAQFFYTEGMAYDLALNLLYVADSNNHLVRVVDLTTKIVSTLAGNITTGEGSYSGDGGPALQAGLNYPTDVALDGSGNLLIVDKKNNCIRNVNLTSKIITTAYGTCDNAVYTCATTCSNYPTLSGLQLNQPTGVSVIGTGSNQLGVFLKF
jgi:hypothetical protein